MAEKKANGNISVTERNELRKVVKGRFKILKARLTRRRHALEETIRQRLIDETAKEAKTYETRYSKVKQAERKAEEDYRKTAAKLAKERKQIVDEAYEAGFDVDVRYSYSESEERYQFVPVDLREKVRSEIEQLRQGASLASEDLELRELELMETLAVGAIQSDEATAFLNEIPEIDDLLPLPEGYRDQIEA